MSALGLTLSQANYVNKAFWRNPARAFFTFALPLMFLVIFTSLLGTGKEHIGAIWIKESTYYVAAMAAFAVIQACYSNVAMSISAQRDSGILKRIDGSPLPKRSFMGARILHSVLVAVILVALTAVFGRLVYSANIPTGISLLHFLAMLAVGSASFCALGLAVAALIPNADAATPIIQASILPLLFVSGIFIAFGDNTPAWITWIARIFPVRHFFSGLMSGFVGTPFDWMDVLVVAAWGLAGLFFAIRFFTWEPRTK